MKTLLLAAVWGVFFVVAAHVPADTPKASTPVKGKEPAVDKAKAPAPIYDEQARAEMQIARALAAAKKENRRVLIQWGANWCPWCHVLNRCFKTDNNLAKTISYEYEFVLVDVGRRTKNMDLARHYGADLTKNGIPFLTVLDCDGKKIVNQATEPFEKPDKKERGYKTDKLADFLTKNEPAHLKADEVLAEALKNGTQTQKLVFLHFGAPSCGWCKRLETWLAQLDIAPIMARDFVDAKIDLDRMAGAQEIYRRYCSKPQGIPWVVILDGKGKALVDSDGPQGNIGYPAEDAEIAHFVKMIQTVKHSLTEADVDHLRESLATLAKQYVHGHDAAAKK
jgi:thioredoxin-related protein